MSKECFWHNLYTCPYTEEILEKEEIKIEPLTINVKILACFPHSIVGRWIYACGIVLDKESEISDDINFLTIDELTFDGVTERKQVYVTLEDINYSILGTTFSSTKQANIGDVITVSTSFIKQINDVNFQWYIPKVIEVLEKDDKNIPDSNINIKTLIEKTSSKIKEISEELDFDRFEDCYDFTEEEYNLLR